MIAWIAASGFVILYLYNGQRAARGKKFSQWFFYLFYPIMKKEAWKRWIPLLYVAGVGTCMLSGIGIVTASVLLAVYGVLDFCYYRNWRKTLAIWLAAVPCVIFLGYYLM